MTDSGQQPECCARSSLFTRPPPVISNGAARRLFLAFAPAKASGCAERNLSASCLCGGCPSSFYSPVYCRSGIPSSYVSVNQKEKRATAGNGDGKRGQGNGGNGDGETGTGTREKMQIRDSDGIGVQ